LKTKQNNPIAFHETKWFKLTCMLCFFGWLFYMAYSPFEINKNELLEIRVTITEHSKSEGSRNPIRIYFKTKEYANRFGIYGGGTFGRWTEVMDALAQKGRMTIKFHKSNKKNLNVATEVIPVYYINSDFSGLVFNEDEFNQGEKSSDNRFIGFLIFLFIICLWKILRE
jgi:hypothetical protein